MHFEHHNNYEDRGLLSNPDCHPSDSNGIHGNWTRIEARKQRKKVQNRINQRAHRRRISEKKAQNSKTTRRPYRIDRWRIGDINASQPEDTTWHSANDSANRTSSHRGPRGEILPLPGPGNNDQSTALAVKPADSGGSHRMQFPLSSDHLIHLIHYNVFRALVSNKNVLKLFATIITQSNDLINPHHGKRLCDGPTVIHPLHLSLPDSLLPTSLQMVYPHSNWIDMFPFPQIRDNLIRREGYFDVMEFWRDLFGDLVNENISITSGPCESSLASTSVLLQGEYDDMITAGRKGLIVWGEPYEKGSWEATPGFIKKWTWVLEGCEDLIEISNRWRAIRGEEPIQTIFGSVRTPI